MLRDSWFVYVLALRDCSAFKVGFSCNLLQRICCFSRRYFERFDLYQSHLLRLRSEADARQVEAALKAELHEFRAEAPAWVPATAGGHTEWFSAVHLIQAETHLSRVATSLPKAEKLCPRELIRLELSSLAASFEPWAWSQAREVCDASARYDRQSIEAARSLRDWLDAYRFFEVPLFTDDPAVRDFIAATVK